MMDAFPPLIVEWYVARCLSVPYSISSVAILLAVYVVVSAISFRLVHKGCEMAEASIQTDDLVESTKPVTVGVQTEKEKTRSLAVSTDILAEMISVETQTRPCVLDVVCGYSTAMQSSGEYQPDTPSTIEGLSMEQDESFMVAEKERFWHSSPDPEIIQLENNNANVKECKKPLYEVVNSFNQSFMRPLPIEASIDTEVLLKSAMDSMTLATPLATPLGGSPQSNQQTGVASSIFFDSDKLFNSVPEWNCATIDRYTTSDTFVSANGGNYTGGSVYRTISDPTSSVYSGGDCLMDGLLPSPSASWYHPCNSSPTVEETNRTGYTQYSSYDPFRMKNCYNFENTGDAGAGYSTHEESCEHVLSKIRLSKEYQLNVARLISNMQKVFANWIMEQMGEKNSASEISLVPYGSVASGLGLNNGSVDLALLIPIELMGILFSGASNAAMGSSNSTSTSSIPIYCLKEMQMKKMIKLALTKAGEVWHQELGLKFETGGKNILSVPVISFADGQFSVQVSCNNLFPMFSTRLMKCYADLDPSGNMRDFILLAKQWNNANQCSGAPSGFIITLMCVFYCQVAHRVLSLQAICPERKQWRDPFGSRRCDVGFVDNLSNQPSRMKMQSSAAELFVGFINYYANCWNWAPIGNVISVRLGKVVSIHSPEILLKQTPVKDTYNYVLHIEDPFDTKRNIGLNMTPAEIEKFRNHFKLSSENKSNIEFLFH